MQGAYNLAVDKRGYGFARVPDHERFDNYSWYYFNLSENQDHNVYHPTSETDT